MYRTRVVQKLLANHYENQNKQAKTTTKNDPQIPQPDLRFATEQNSEATKNGAGPNKNRNKNKICLGYSDLSHCIILKSMQSN